MLIGEIFLETMATGIITQEEIDWLTTHQSTFERDDIQQTITRKLLMLYRQADSLSCH